MKGIVKPGFGKGAYYIGLPTYKNQIIEKLGFTPFIGTLNVQNGDKAKFVQNLKRIIIKGDSAGCDCDCYMVNISAKGKTCKGAIIIPVVTDHKENITELISPDYLREKLDLNDGDEVEINE